MKFGDIFGWFPHEHVVTLEALMKEYKVRNVIEIGSFLGRSTVFFADHCDHVTAIDPFKHEGWDDAFRNGDIGKYSQEDFYEQFLTNIQLCGVSDKVSPIRMGSVEAAKTHYGIKADLVYIDGAHDYESIKRDIALWAPRAMKIVCGDDYDENWPGVKQAVDEAFPDRIISGRVWYKII